MTSISATSQEIPIPGRTPLFDLSGIDLNARALDRDGIAELIPHRDTMALLDAIVWKSDDLKRGVAVKHIGDDEFWVSGHFPDHPMFPGVLMIESAAQLAVYLYNLRWPDPRIAAFTRIEHATFRHAVVPGDDLFLLCEEVKFSRRRFISNVQGLVGGERVAFEARIHGLEISSHSG